MIAKRPLWVQPFNAKLAGVLIAIVILGYLVIVGKEVMSPLVFSVLFSILLLPLAKWFEKSCRFSKSLSAMLSLVVMITVIGVVLYLVGSQISRLSSDWPLFKEQMSSSAEKFQEWVALKFHINEAKQLKYVNTATGKLLDSSTGMVSATLVSLSSMLLFMVFTFIYTFLFLIYRSLIMKFLVAVFLENNAVTVKDVIEQVQYIIRKYIVGLMLEMGIVSGVVSISFSIMGIKYAILLGIITGLFNLVPYVGIFTAMLLSVIITFATGAATAKIILVLVTLIIVHLIDSNILLPLIVGSKVKINALVTVIGVIVGELIWGIPGMFLSIPVIAIMKIIFDRVESLKPWGMILGDEEEKKRERRLKKTIKVIEEAIE